MNRIVTRIVVGVIVGLILMFIAKMCTDPPPLPPECEEKVIQGRIINYCDLEYIHQVDVDANSFVMKSNPSDNKGKFEIILKDCGEKNIKFKFKKTGHADYEEIFLIDFDEEGTQNIGEVKLKPDTGCNSCQGVKKVIYNLINEKSYEDTGTSIYHVGKGTISLDAMFEMELRDSLEPYLIENDLNYIKKECPDYHEIMKWIGRHEIKPFEVGEYEIPKGQKALLDLFINRVKNKQDEWKINFSEINCVGSTDKQEVSLGSKQEITYALS